MTSLQHARRVLKILDLEDQIEGLVYCDYQQTGFTCKPEPEYYQNVSIIICGQPNNIGLVLRRP